jgi:hypothetical protein
MKLVASHYKKNPSAIPAEGVKRKEGRGKRINEASVLY